MKAFIAWLKRHHILHTWGAWEKYQYTHTPLIGGMPVTSMAVEITGQQRRCEVCKKYQSEPT